MTDRRLYQPAYFLPSIVAAKPSPHNRDYQQAILIPAQTRFVGYQAASSIVINAPVSSSAAFRLTPTFPATDRTKWRAASTFPR